MTPSPPRLWPYVLAGMVCALILLAFLEPMPVSAPLELAPLGPDSPLYGPIK